MLQEKSTNTENPIIWATISNGAIITRCESTDPKAVKRINKLGKEVYERHWASIFGYVKTIQIEDNKFGETDIKVGLEDEGNTLILSFKLDSSYGRSFLSQIFNADLTKKIKITPWQKITEEGQKKTRLYLSYGVRNMNIEWKLPAGTPEVKFVDVKGKKVIDNISQIQHMDFLVEKLNDLIKSKGLEYVAEKVDLGENVDTGELSADELNQLNKAKKQNAKKEVDLPPPTQEDDDFFNSL